MRPSTVYSTLQRLLHAAGVPQIGYESQEADASPSPSAPLLE